MRWGSSDDVAPNMANGAGSRCDAVDVVPWDAGTACMARPARWKLAGSCRKIDSGWRRPRSLPSRAMVLLRQRSGQARKPLIQCGELAFCGPAEMHRRQAVLLDRRCAGLPFSPAVAGEPDESPLFDLQPGAQRAQLSRELDGSLAQPGAEARIRRRHRRRRRPWAGDRLLPRQGARHHQCRGDREGLARRRQYRAQHDDRALQLSLGRKRASLRAFAEAVGGSVPGPELQRHVQPARPAQPRPQPA